MSRGARNLVIGLAQFAACGATAHDLHTFDCA